jgi:hypothetical protein
MSTQERAEYIEEQISFIRLMQDCKAKSIHPNLYIQDLNISDFEINFYASIFHSNWDPLVWEAIQHAENQYQAPSRLLKQLKISLAGEKNNISKRFKDLTGEYLRIDAKEVYDKQLTGNRKYIVRMPCEDEHSPRQTLKKIWILKEQIKEASPMEHLDQSVDLICDHFNWERPETNDFAIEEEKTTIREIDNLPYRDYSHMEGEFNGDFN